MTGLPGHVLHWITTVVGLRSLNSKIQALKAAARGFRRFTSYRSAILSHRGELALPPILNPK